MHKNLLASVCLVLAALVMRAADGKLLDVASHNLNNDLELTLAQKFSDGDKLIIKGKATAENDSKIELYRAKTDKSDWQLIGQQDHPAASNDFTIGSSHLDCVNNGLIILRGKNYEVTEIWYSGANELTPGNRGDNPDKPVDPDPVNDPVVIVPDINYYIKDWNSENYKVRLQQQFEVGDKLIITVTGSKVKAKFCDNTGFDPETDTDHSNVFCEDYNIGGNKKEIVVTTTDANLNWLNTGGIIVQGENVTVNSISYQGVGEAVAGTTLFDGQEPPRELETWDLLPRVADIGIIVPAWKGKATVSDTADGGKTITATEAGVGAGVYANDIKADEAGNLDLNSYLTPRESTEENPAPLSMFNKWGKLKISLAEACDGAVVTVYYRDIAIEEFLKDEPDLTNVGVNARPVAFEFAAGAKTMEIPLDAYRYVRAISITLPAAGSMTVTELALVERENYNGAGLSLWSSPGHLGTYLGRKSFYGTDDLDWNRGTDDSITPAWVTAQTADCSQVNALYPHIIIVYKNAEVVHAQNGLTSDAAPQIQAYLNLPCYDIDHYTDEDREYWNTRTWSYTSGSGEEIVDEKVVQRPNNDPRAENLIVPVVAGIHTLRADHEYRGSYYAEIPDAKYGKYSYAEIYVNGKQEVTYPVKAETPAAGVMSRAGEAPDIATGNKLDLLKQYGIAVRGQNVTLMKIAYLGDIRDNYTDLDVPEEILHDTSTYIETVIAAPAQPDEVDVYNLQGMMVRRGVAPENATSGLRQGIYIVNGKKVWVK